ncbi:MULTISPECIES: hypothetical protein [Bacillus cereus group]|uniref:Uncharacterized protein n=1 Tax=Bacillus thuringiensis subsp. darmstadiensis TaxID=132264 RepID=A0A9X6IRJ9_BACUD|nr:MULTISPECIES: hypothetical protein [Bacillus cereus group]ADH05645.1 hypothetical protein BMB171_C0828 [Bacillus thuringiensis BMB171]MDZ4486074.1 hypothetical protein [Bacillus cereus]OTZ29307.1 hypothetical protein BK761_24060 [Bacillus thuringiensis serovar darmstadiensis]USK97911.1 hypothetical protein LIS81_04885 [Bacillus tropicus]HDR6293988.1 hypothetical protein [Bacillus cereus]
MAEKLYDRLEIIWEKHSFAISFIICVFVGILYFNGLVTNIRMVTGNVVMFASMVVAVNGVFLTLIITLQESPAFIRLKGIFPDFQKKLYLSLRDQIHFGILVVAMSILINILPPSPNKYLSSIGVGVWFFFFILMGLGSFFSVKLVTDIIVKNFKTPTRSRRQ